MSLCQSIITRTTLKTYSNSQPLHCTGKSQEQRGLAQMKRSWILNLTLAVALISLAAYAANTGQVDIPIATSLLNSCNGEIIDVSGTLHADGTLTVNANNASATIHFNPQGVTGIGETTGATYRGTGVTQSVLN